ncbi:MAG: hypothetical protein NVSMB28_24460 [Collimonas sp.]
MHSPYPPFAAIEQAMGEVIIKVRARGIRLRNAEFVTTSEEWDDSLGVLIFYENDSDIVAYEKDGTTDMIKLKFLEELAASKLQFSFSELPEMDFVFDSHENVVKNYDGSYFLRLR